MATEDWVKAHAVEELRLMKEIGGAATMTLMHAKEHVKDIIEEVNKEKTRVNDVVTEANNIKDALNMTYGELKQQGADIGVNIAEVNEKMRYLNEGGVYADNKLGAMQEQFDLTIEQSNTYAKKMEDVTKKHADDLEDAKKQIHDWADKVQQDIASGTGIGPFGKSEGRSNSQKLNAKDLAVWKLPS